MREVGVNKHADLWAEAMKSETQPSREDFDRFLAGYEV
jgi:hypothetical protein